MAPDGKWIAFHVISYRSMRMRRVRWHKAFRRLSTDVFVGNGFINPRKLLLLYLFRMDLSL